MSAAVLYIVPTPIGNLGDMVPRALKVLQTVDVIFAEDTRHSRKLLNHFAIDTPVQSFHEHSRLDEAEKIIARLQAGDNIALISDAGTPLISDPGYQLVKLAHEQEITVTPIPGPCAAITALSASGLACDRFFFEGFLPAKQAARQQRLSELSNMPATIICYESPHRIAALLSDACEVLGDERQCTIARELTKQFETIRSGRLADIRDFVLSDSNQQRGELVWMLSPAVADSNQQLDSDSERVLDILLQELSVKQAAALGAKITGKSKRVLYSLALEKKP